ncbi:xanthine dehydrogenase accessory protein XdhC [Serratia odorifera]|uniref:Xanthine dehydrogenase accessory protein XdhC n=1 Tax=Serratia odorifera TaxID=618 RepID=A0A3S4EH55_SEROD|nr:xanthine dehydrogenase accessory protein XdhC [Serratia odorifera]
MEEWIDALAELRRRGEPCVLVTVLDELGSTPRDRGSKMLVSAERVVNTIGGGHLEYRALAIARQMLQTGSATMQIERFPLAARLGQCCGGTTRLLFEPLIPPGHSWRCSVPATLVGRWCRSWRRCRCECAG